MAVANKTGRELCKCNQIPGPAVRGAVNLPNHGKSTAYLHKVISIHCAPTRGLDCETQSGFDCQRCVVTMGLALSLLQGGILLAYMVFSVVKVRHLVSKKLSFCSSNNCPKTEGQLAPGPLSLSLRPAAFLSLSRTSATTAVVYFILRFPTHCRRSSHACDIVAPSLFVRRTAVLRLN